MPGDFAQVLEGRLAALGRAAARSDLTQLLAHELGDPSRYTLEGPEIALHPDWAFALSLLFHELAVNALRHGALSIPEGHVDVGWHIDEGNLVLSWQETGGPPVRRPSAPGFGNLLVRYAAVKLEGSANLLYFQSGLRCDLRVSLHACWPQRRGAMLIAPRETHTLPTRAM